MKHLERENIHTEKDTVDFENVHLFESKANGKQPLNPRLSRNFFFSSSNSSFRSPISHQIPSNRRWVTYVMYVSFHSGAITLFVKTPPKTLSLLSSFSCRYPLIKKKNPSEIMQSSNAYFCSLKDLAGGKGEKEKKRTEERRRGKRKNRSRIVCKSVISYFHLRRH